MVGLYQRVTRTHEILVETYCLNLKPEVLKPLLTNPFDELCLPLSLFPLSPLICNPCKKATSILATPGALLDYLLNIDRLLSSLRDMITEGGKEIRKTIMEETGSEGSFLR